MQKLFKEKVLEKNGHKDVRSIENNGYLDAHHKKEIVPALENISRFNKRDVSKEHSRIRLAAKYSKHMHILI